MSSFSERLKELRLEKRLTQEELAEKFYLNKSSISRYERGQQVPELELLKKIADFFGVGTDFLLGKSDMRIPYKEAPEKTEEDIDLWLSKTDGYKELPEEEREIISSIAKKLLEKHRKEK
ncbi:HTH-type transcriptional regulator Xre [bioreactor metagenome]|uniref:HTH-type transcriptional regulator Xre n=1 Tax=bioreactor metagenome TaxID=1076179 RepID=A0A645FGP5_9ZZZZ